MSTPIHSPTHIHAHKQTHTQTHTHTRVCTHTCTCTHTHTYTHLHMYTFTHPPGLKKLLSPLSHFGDRSPTTKKVLGTFFNPGHDLSSTKEVWYHKDFRLVLMKIKIWPVIYKFCFIGLLSDIFLKPACKCNIFLFVKVDHFDPTHCWESYLTL